jgi:hypothetical protein
MHAWADPFWSGASHDESILIASIAATSPPMTRTLRRHTDLVVDVTAPGARSGGCVALPVLWGR